MKDEHLFKSPDPIPAPVMVSQPRAENPFGEFQTVVVAPTVEPKTYLDQIQFYTDSLTAPTVYKLYFYSTNLKVWKSVTLT